MQASSASDNQSGNTYSQIAVGAIGSNNPAVKIFAALNIAASGTFTATVNFSAVADATVIIAEFSGVASASADEGANTATGSGTSVSVSTSTAITDAGDVVIGVLSHDGATTAMTEAGTLIAEQEDNATSQAGNAQYVLPGSTGVKTLTWTMGASSGWLAAIVALKPAATSAIGIDALSALTFNAVDAFDVTTGGPAGVDGYAYGFGQVAKKTTTTTRTANNTPAADPALVITDLDASSTYLFHTVAFFDTTAAADFKVMMTFDGASSVRCVRKSVAAGATAFVVSTDLTAGSSSPTMSITGTGTNGGMVDVWCMAVFGASTPQATFVWSQDTSDAGNTSVLAGSFIEFTKVT